jgi:outer membrane lipoprotein-sorting protein
MEMTLLARSARLRGVVVVVAAGALVAASAVLAGVARSSPSLPDVTPQRLVANMIRVAATDPPLSGTLSVHLGLGFPDLPDEGSGAVSGPAAILASLTGDHRVRAWHSPDGARVSDLLPTGERSIVLSRTQAWLWDSTSMTAVRLGAGADPGTEQAARTAASLVDPVALARQALAALDPSTRVTVSDTASVAGRSAYVLTLEPRTDQTLVGRVELYVDASRWLPLGGAIFARGSNTAAVSAKFTSVSFGAVDPAVFRFTPPPGATVLHPGQGSASGSAAPSTSPCDPMVMAPCGPPVGADDKAKAQQRFSTAEQQNVRVFGQGWATVVAVRAPSVEQLQKGLQGNGFDVTGLLPFSGTLFSARLAGSGDDTWLLFGAVPQSTLERAAAELP